jgi:hypothetical protein
MAKIFINILTFFTLVLFSGAPSAQTSSTPPLESLSAGFIATSPQYYKDEYPSDSKKTDILTAEELNQPRLNCLYLSWESSADSYKFTQVLGSSWKARGLVLTEAFPTGRAVSYFPKRSFSENSKNSPDVPDTSLAVTVKPIIEVASPSQIRQRLGVPENTSDEAIRSKLQIGPKDKFPIFVVNPSIYQAEISITKTLSSGTTLSKTVGLLAASGIKEKTDSGRQAVDYNTIHMFSVRHSFSPLVSLEFQDGKTSEHVQCSLCFADCPTQRIEKNSSGESKYLTRFFGPGESLLRSANEFKEKAKLDKAPFHVIAPLNPWRFTNLENK